ncbi:hypothetical protein BDK51DRAFT_52791 [Blyttiomyces helicus]|uniref:Uncharacterized protein n=1 Tax=Blyttiomyces helicus TaxID=388810 RepID=A0A4P9WAE8_9FUNG|nr:hypothetical protein BDK51DRAFT_52791 [Blyttiomyces helicus]|eukprot:RKO88483.1 hypothetical protein BDK51DRAFT_52791 [Blyttiomyces helicus]
MVEASTLSLLRSGTPPPAGSYASVSPDREGNLFSPDACDDDREGFFPRGGSPNGSDLAAASPEHDLPLRSGFFPPDVFASETAIYRVKNSWVLDPRCVSPTADISSVSNSDCGRSSADDQRIFDQASSSPCVGSASDSVASAVDVPTGGSASPLEPPAQTGDTASVSDFEAVLGRIHVAAPQVRLTPPTSCGSPYEGDSSLTRDEFLVSGNYGPDALRSGSPPMADASRSGTSSTDRNPPLDACLSDAEFVASLVALVASAPANVSSSDRDPHLHLDLQTAIHRLTSLSTVWSADSLRNTWGERGGEGTRITPGGPCQ